MNRPTAYMKPYYNGYFFLGRSVVWRATDYWGNHAASASTRKECEAECRRAGYTPVIERNDMFETVEDEEDED